MTYKKKLEINIPEDKILPYKTYKRYTTHAYNSALWYFNNYSYNTKQIKDKLLRKNFIDEDITVINDDKSSFTINIIEEVIKKLKDENDLDDFYIANEIVESKLRQGYGLNRIKSILYQKKFNKNIIDNVIDKYNNRDKLINDSINKSFKEIINSSSFKKMNKYKQKQKIFQKLAYNGFSFNDINEIILQWEEDDNS